MKKNVKLMMLILALVANFQAAFGLSYFSDGAGLGANIDIDQASHFPRITKIIPGFPAERAGLQVNDLITRVDGVSTYNRSLENVIAQIKGYQGTVCHLVIERFGADYNCTFVRQPFYPTWSPGKTDSYYHIRAAEQSDYWWPMAGYVFNRPGTEDLTTHWKPGLPHPYYKVLASNTPQYWVPAPGYRFIQRNSLETVWTPGIKLEEEHIISDAREGYWQAAPGWKFVSSNSLKTVRVDDSINDGVMVFIDVTAATILESIFGDNMLSDYLYSKAWQSTTHMIESVFKP